MRSVKYSLFIPNVDVYSLVEVAFVVVLLVNTAVFGVVAPMGELLIVPPFMVRSSATRPSASVPLHVGVNVCTLPLEVMVRPIFVSLDVAKVCDAPVCNWPVAPSEVSPPPAPASDPHSN